MAIPEVQKELIAANSILVTSHINPDGDAVGSLLGMTYLLRSLGKNAVATLNDPVPQRYRFLPRVEEIHTVDEADNLGSYDTIVILDAGEIQRIGDVASLIHDHMKVVFIDHHVTSDGNDADAAWIESEASATSEMLQELFRHFEIKPDPETALALYVGIMTDTGRFRFSNTSSRAMASAAALIEQGADPALAAEKVYYTTVQTVVETLGKFLTRLESYDDGKLILSHLTLDEKNVDSEGFIDYITSIKGVIISCLVREINQDEYKVSMRSTNHIDVAAIAEKFGGGGHLKAAGCRIAGNLEQVKEKIINACRESLIAGE